MNRPSRIPSRSDRHLRAVAEPPPRSIDEEILRAWEKNAPEFGGMFYDHLIGVIDGTLIRVLGERTPEHDDLVQNTFEQILLTLAEGRFQRVCSLRSWAAAIASRVALNAIRSRRTKRKYFSSEDVQCVSGRRASDEDIGRATEAREMLAEVRRHLSCLSSQRAEPLVLHDVLGHELVEVAAMIGVTVAAAQSRLVRGRKELQARLEAEGLLTREAKP